jgi:hypothetical protein
MVQYLPPTAHHMLIQRKVVAPELETSGEDYQRILRLTKAGVKVT